MMRTMNTPFYLIPLPFLPHSFSVEFFAVMPPVSNLKTFLFKSAFAGR